MDTVVSETKTPGQDPILVGAVICLCGVSFAIVQCEIPSILPAVTTHFELSAEVASWLMSVFTLIGIITSLPVGKLATRFRPKVLLVASGIIELSGSLLVALAPDAVLLIAGRGIQGFGLVILSVIAPAIIRLCVDPKCLGISMGLWAIGFNVASTVAGVTTPYLSAVLGFSGVWILYGAIAIAAILLTCSVIRIPRHSELPAKDVDTSGKSKLPVQGVTEAASYREVFTRDTVLMLFAFAVFNMLVFATVSYVPSVLQIQGYDATVSGLISTTPMLISIVSGPILGLIYDKTGHLKPMLLICYLAFGPCTCLMLNLTGPLLWATAIFFGFVGMSVSGILITSFLSLIKRYELVPLALGVFMLVQGTGQFLGTFLIQALLGPELTNWLLAGLVALIAGLLASAAILICRIPRRENMKTEASAKKA